MKDLTPFPSTWELKATLRTILLLLPRAIVLFWMASDKDVNQRGGKSRADAVHEARFGMPSRLIHQHPTNGSSKLVNKSHFLFHYRRYHLGHDV